MDLKRYSDRELASLLPWPAPDANKYTRGKLVLVAGCARYPGAACLAARAASRMGAGYVHVSCADGAVSTVRSFQPSLVVSPWSQGVPLGARADERKPVAYAVGPGFDAADEQCRQIALAVLQSAADSSVPLIVDGGALAALSDDRGLGLLASCAKSGAPAVVTPHGGEAARLAASAGVSEFGGLPGDDRGQADFARRLSGALRAVVVLKGPDTYVAFGDEVAVVTEGTAALAKAGTGDVLAGLVGGLLAQGTAPLDAAVLATALHARAGAVAADRLTSICVLPEDVAEAVPDAIRSLLR